MVFICLTLVYLFIYLLMTIWTLVQTHRALNYSKKIKNSSESPSVTLIKPIKGINPYTEECFLSWLNQKYLGNVQYIFSFQDEADEALTLVRKLQNNFDIEVIINPVLHGYSGKTSNIYFGLQKAKHELLILSDSDILAPEDSISKIVSQMGSCDIVSCITKHTHSESIWAKVYSGVWNAITVSLVPSAILNKWFPAIAGGTIGIKRKCLEQLGGIQAVSNYIAEDGALAVLANQANLAVGVGPTVVSPVGKIKFLDLWYKLMRGNLTALKMNPSGLGATLTSYILLFLFWILIAISLLTNNFSVLAISGCIFIIRLFQASYISSVCNKNWRIAFEVILADFLSIGSICVAAFYPYVYWGPIKFKVLKNGVLQRLST